MESLTKIISIAAGISLSLALLGACHTVDASNDSGSAAPAAASSQTPESAEASSTPNDSKDASADAATNEKAEEQAVGDSANTTDENAHATNESHLSPDDIPQNLIGCEVKIQVDQKFYSAMAVAISIEEALDHAVYEACAIPCAETANAGAETRSDDDKEADISKCTDLCSDSAIPVDAECIQNGQTIFTGGSFNEPAGQESEDAPDAG